MVGDSEIDTKKVDNSKKLDEFDNETQGHLRKVLYEQERKRHGLPTTEEAQQQENIKKMFEGSDFNPFAQVPYDKEKYGRKDGTNAPQSPFAPH